MNLNLSPKCSLFLKNCELNIFESRSSTFVVKQIKAFQDIYTYMYTNIAIMTPYNHQSGRSYTGNS